MTLCSVWIGLTDWALVFIYGLESMVHVKIVEFTVVLVLNDAAELIVSKDLIKLSLRSDFN
jgi:hypothetical protein